MRTLPELLPSSFFEVGDGNSYHKRWRSQVSSGQLGSELSRLNPGPGLLQCKVCMLFICFLSFWISTNGVKYFSHAARLVLTKSLCSLVILSDSLPSAVAATWLPTSVSRSVYRWNVPSAVGWRAVTVMRPRSADFYSNMSELFRNFPTCASWTDKELETNMYNVS